ncbi:UNVERIFIED_CONTAM: hypothetical protein Sangu_1083500 [Sesamum angustifolium]|uniref:Uncharacterized protein n=1 Tax=Sesamum angustifolium TaxID=2727405 RepID=A0AAW2NXA8_9LAMI
MTNPNNGGDHGSYKGDSFLPAASGTTVPSIQPTFRDANVPSPDPAPRVNAPMLAPTLNQTVGPVVLNPLFCEQFR